MPIEEQRTFSLLKLIHKSINDVSFPAIIKLELRNTLPSLRRQNVVSFQPSMVNGTFQDSAKIFYTLPINLQSVTSFNTFCSKVKSFLLGQALAKFTNIWDYCYCLCLFYFLALSSFWLGVACFVESCLFLLCALAAAYLISFLTECHFYLH